MFYISSDNDFFSISVNLIIIFLSFSSLIVILSNTIVNTFIYSFFHRMEGRAVEVLI